MERKIGKIGIMIALLLMSMVLMANVLDVKLGKTINARADNSSDLSTTLIKEGWYILSQPPPIEWNKTYGGTEWEVAYALVQTGDGGYAIAGYTGSFGAGPGDFWLVKTDASGAMQWSQTYGGTGSEGASALVQTDDGGYALAGTTTFGAGDYDFWLVKTDASGAMQWSQTYGGTGPGGEEAHALVQTGDGGYALAGPTWSFGAGFCDFWLVKTDASGAMQWSQTYGGTGIEEAHALVQTGDGGYALAGGTDSFGTGGTDFWLVKTDASGAMQWSQTYGGTGEDWAWALVQTDDGGYALAGTTESFGTGDYDFWLVKTDASGAMQWSQTYGGTGIEEAHALVQTGDGGYAIAGWAHTSFGTDADFWLVKVAPALTHDIAISHIAASKTVVGQGSSLDINVTMENQGDYAETFNVTAYYNLTQPPGLVGYWKFDEGLGTTAYDSSGYNNHGTVYGATWTSGKINNALNFDGVDDYVYVYPNPSLDMTDELTIEAWVKSVAPTVEDAQDIVRQGNFLYGKYRYGLHFWNNQRFSFNTHDGTTWYSTGGSARYSFGEWHHVAAVFKNGEYMKLYVNGQFVNESASPAINTATGEPVYIGAEIYGQMSRFWNGFIDEVKIYNRTLSREEIVAHMMYYGIIGTQTVTLESGASTTITFTWNTTGFAKGNYTISAYAWPVPGETDTEDNRKISTVQVVISVGGIDIPVDKLTLLAPHIGVASTVLVATAAIAIYVKRLKHRKEKQ